jgi:hypothetical protein
MMLYTTAVGPWTNFLQEDKVEVHMPYLSNFGLLKFQDLETYVFMPHGLKVQDSPNCLEVLKYGTY